MFCSTVTIFLVFLITLSMVVASPISDVRRHEPVSPDNYARSIAQWKGIVEGRELTLNGTVTEVRSQLDELYPNRNLFSRDTEVAAPVTKRNKIGLLCVPVPGQPWGGAFGGDILDASNYLQNSLGPSGAWAIGPNSCALVACFGHAGVQVCNNNNWLDWINGGYLASFVGDIYNDCRNPINNLAGGQEFDDGGFNVIVWGVDGC